MSDDLPRSDPVKRPGDRRGQVGDAWSIRSHAFEGAVSPAQDTDGNEWMGWIFWFGATSANALLCAVRFKLADSSWWIFWSWILH